MKKTFEVIQNIPSPYRIHLFNIMWKQLSASGYDFHVNFMSEGHCERPDSWKSPNISFPHTYWRDCGVGTHHFNPGLLLKIFLHRPDVLLIGSPFDTFTSILVGLLCPARVRCAWVEGQTKTPGKMNGVLGWVKRLVLSKYPFVGVPGSDGKRYIDQHQRLTRRKMPESIYLPNLVDETRFMMRKKWPEAEITRIRERLGAGNEERLCLIPARLDEVKGLVEFVSLLTSEMVRGWRVVIMGQGPLKDKILSTAQQKGVSRELLILDYVPYADMPKYYAAADLFLLPSLHDPNPLSVVEALHSGLPIALTDRAGNVEEAVSEGVNGWILPVGDNDKMSDVLIDVFSATRDELETKGKQSSAFASFWNSETAIKRFLEGILG